MQLRNAEARLLVRIDRLLERMDERLHRRRIRTLLARRRHHADAQLLEHLLGDLGVVERLRRIEELELQATLVVGVVVAAEAILVEQLALRVRPGSGFPGGGAARG